MLETMRAYGAERLAEAGETETVAARRTTWCLELAERAAVRRTARRWLRLLDADYDNLRAALDRAVAGRDPDIALRLAADLGWYWWTRHTLEGHQRLAAVVALADGRPPTPALARALQASAMLEVAMTPTAAGRRRRPAQPGAVRAVRGPLGVAFSSCCRRGWGCSGSSPAPTPSAWSRRPRRPSASWATRGARPSRAGRFAMEAYLHGLSERGEEAGRRALERFRALDDQWGLAQSRVSMAELASARGDLDSAVAGYEAAMAAAGDGGPMWVVLASIVRLSTMVALKGDDAQAAALRAEAADRIRRFGELRGSPTSTTRWAASPAPATTWSAPGVCTGRRCPSSGSWSAGASPTPSPRSPAPRPASATSTTPRRTCRRRPACCSPRPRRRPWPWS